MRPENTLARLTVRANHNSISTLRKRLDFASRPHSSVCIEFCWKERHTPEGGCRCPKRGTTRTNCAESGRYYIATNRKKRNHSSSGAGNEEKQGQRCLNLKSSITAMPCICWCRILNPGQTVLPTQANSRAKFTTSTEIGIVWPPTWLELA